METREQSWIPQHNYTFWSWCRWCEKQRWKQGNKAESRNTITLFEVGVDGVRNKDGNKGTKLNPATQLHFLKLVSMVWETKMETREQSWIPQHNYTFWSWCRWCEKQGNKAESRNTITLFEIGVDGVRNKGTKLNPATQLHFLKLVSMVWETREQSWIPQHNYTFWSWCRWCEKQGNKAESRNTITLFEVGVDGVRNKDGNKGTKLNPATQLHFFEV